MKIFERGPITPRGLSTCHLSKERKNMPQFLFEKKKNISWDSATRYTYQKGGKKEEESWAKIIKYINFKPKASSPATPVLPKNTEYMQEGSGSYHLNSNTSTGHWGNISWNRKNPITCALQQEKFILFLTLQLKMKLLFETKICLTLIILT